MGQQVRHQYIRSGFQAQMDNGSVQTGLVCKNCGHHRIEWDFLHYTIKDNFLDDVDEDLGIEFPPPDCPPSAAWQGVSRILKRLLDLKRRRDSLRAAAAESDGQLKSWLQELADAIQGGTNVDWLFEDMGLDDEDNAAQPVCAFVSERPMEFTGQEERYELLPASFRNLN